MKPQDRLAARYTRAVCRIFLVDYKCTGYENQLPRACKDMASEWTRTQLADLDVNGSVRAKAGILIVWLQSIIGLDSLSDSDIELIILCLGIITVVIVLHVLCRCSSRAQLVKRKCL